MKKQLKNRQNKKTKSKIVLVCIIAFLVFLCIPFIINIIAAIPNSYVVGEPNSVEATWIGFLGDYVGGFLSTLVGAGISGIVAYYLLSREIDENIRRKTLNTFSLEFNKDFQKVKNGIIESTANVHKVLQYYHAKFSNTEVFMKEYHDELDAIYQMNTEISRLVNEHIFLLSYIKAQEDELDPSLGGEQFANIALFFNDMRMKFAKSNGSGYDLIAEYNEIGVPMINEYRARLVKNEKIIIATLFPELSPKRDFKLSEIPPILETSYDEILKKYSSNKEWAKLI